MNLNIKAIQIMDAKLPICSHKFSQNVYPSKANSFSPIEDILKVELEFLNIRASLIFLAGENTLSIVILNISFIILISRVERKGHDSSREGLELTSIRQTWPIVSTMKSQPSSSKQCFLLGLLNGLLLLPLFIFNSFFLVAFRVIIIWSFIWVTMSFRENFLLDLLRKSSNSLKDPIFPSSYREQLEECFWMALLVRCMKRFLSLELDRSKYSEASLIQPSL